MKFKNKTLITAVALGIATTSSLLFAEDNSKLPTPKAPITNSTNQQTTAWLGVTLQRVPSALASQLSHIIPQGQGVLVASVSNNSPAKKAGIKVNDVLLSVDGQKLYSASQLSGLVRSAKPDNKVNFKVVQQGQLKEISVTLGKHSKSNWQLQNPFAAHNGFGNMPSWASPQLAPLTPNGSGNTPHTKVFGSFESVQVNTLPDGRYHAEVSYKNKANESKKFSFEGKREEIIEQVKAHKELPDDKKRSLINALNMNLGGMSQPFAGSALFNQFFNQPFFRGQQPGFFNDPFFNDPFFRNSFPRGLFMNPAFPQRRLAPQAPSNPIPQDMGRKEELI